jgi:hypothetical protein
MERPAWEQAAVQILPGAIPLDDVTPIDAGLFGRCSVCGLQAAGNLHAGSDTSNTQTNRCSRI